MTPETPKDRQIYESEIARYWIDDNGFLVSISKNITRTVENIGANVELVKRITNNKPVPLLIYLTNSPVPDKQTRKFSAEQVPNIYSAMAMVASSGLSKLIMNMVFGLKKPPIPMKSFSDSKAAIDWLKLQQL